MTRPDRYICPHCKQRAGVRIVYGDFDPDGLSRIPGDFVLGGGGWPVDGPERECTACGHQWRIRRRLGKDSQEST